MNISSITSPNKKHRFGIPQRGSARRKGIMRLNSFSLAGAQSGVIRCLFQSFPCLRHCGLCFSSRTAWFPRVRWPRSPKKPEMASFYDAL